MEKISSDGRVEMMCSVVAVFIMAFVVFYMFYSNNFFMRRRMKELGIYALLGYRKGDMLRLLTIENIFVCLGGMFAGILAGSLLHIGITAGIVALLGLTIDMGAIPFINPQAVSSIFLFILAVLLILQRMGYNKNMIKRCVRRQIQIYFVIPYVIGMLHSIFAIICYKSALMDDVLGQAGEVILPIALAVGIFSIVYFIYYEVTKYSCYKAAMN